MLFEFPKDMTYTKMAMYVDKNIDAIGNDTDNTIYVYLYHLAYMLASKKRFFSIGKYYDEFAAFLATRVYMRLKNKNLGHIKSCLNYMKSILYPSKVDFEQQEYSQLYMSLDDGEDVELSQFSISSYIEQENIKLNCVESEVYLQQLSKTLKSFLSRIPYKYGSAVWNDIYLSCLLTMLSSITLKESDKRHAHSLTSIACIDNFINSTLSSERESRAKLFHLPLDMKDYIEVLTREMKHVISSELSYSSNTQILDFVTLGMILGCEEDYVE